MFRACVKERSRGCPHRPVSYPENKSKFIITAICQSSACIWDPSFASICSFMLSHYSCLMFVTYILPPSKVTSSAKQKDVGESSPFALFQSITVLQNKIKILIISFFFFFFLVFTKLHFKSSLLSYEHAAHVSTIYFHCLR